MTTTPERTTVDTVTLTIDDQRIAVPEGTLVIRAAELLGIEIPRFCDHPLLEPVGACRQCLVEVEGQRKPVASCTTSVAPDMAVRTRATSAAVESAQRGVMELLLINHPLDCPVCDKGGECPLQNQAVSAGRTESRFDKAKRTYPKPIPLSSQVLLDRERCVLCARCTRFSTQIAGDPFIELLERGALQQVGVADGATFDSYFSGNAVQICPVGALTGTAYRFRARPFDLVSSPSVCEHCASGCAQRTDHRRGKVLRRLAGDDPEVNEEWNCDKGRWAFAYASVGDRITTPLIRERGALREATWSEALDAAAAGLRAAAGSTGVLVGGRCTVEDAYAYSEFARTVLCTNDIDFRARPHSAEEEWFLGSRIAGNPMAVTYADLVAAPTVVLAGLEPEEESPIVFLRLRRTVRTRGLQVVAVAPFRTRGLSKLDGRLVMTAPGDEAAALASLTVPAGAIVLVGERLASSTGALMAAAELADRCGARLAWVPRRAGERGALEAGCLPTLLPGGRPVAHPRAREQTAGGWRGAVLPVVPGRDTDGMLAAASAGQLRALVVGGVDLDDLVDPTAARAAIKATGFVVSLEVRTSVVSEMADVVFPIAPVAEKAGTFLTWEGRPRAFGAALESNSLSDQAVLRALARSMGGDLSAGECARAIREWDGTTPAPPVLDAPAIRVPHQGEALLVTWKSLLDAGRLLDGSDRLTASARPALARLSAATAAEIGAVEGEPITVTTDAGRVTLPVAVTDMPDRVVWVPTNSAGFPVHARLRVSTGAVVGISKEVR